MKLTVLRLYGAGLSAGSDCSPIARRGGRETRFEVALRCLGIPLLRSEKERWQRGKFAIYVAYLRHPVFLLQIRVELWMQEAAVALHLHLASACSLLPTAKFT